MRRAETGRDRGLTARMVVALVLLAGLYVLLVAALYGCYRLWPEGWPYFLLVAVVLVGCTIASYHGAERVLLRSVGARIVTAADEPDLARRVERLAGLADVPVPRLAIVETDAPNAFAVGLTPRRAVVVVTRGLGESLSGPELDAVLAHEVAHLAHRDALVMTAASVPRTTGYVLVDADGVRALTLLVWPLGVPMIVLGTLITLTISRYREFEADRGSVLLTGRPEELMSALVKLSSEEPIPELDLRELALVEAFCIVPVAPARWTFLMDHPTLEQRLAALSAMARTQGKVAA